MVYTVWINIERTIPCIQRKWDAEIAQFKSVVYVNNPRENRPKVDGSRGSNNGGCALNVQLSRLFHLSFGPRDSMRKRSNEALCGTLE